MYYVLYALYVLYVPYVVYAMYVLYILYELYVLHDYYVCATCVVCAAFGVCVVRDVCIVYVVCVVCAAWCNALHGATCATCVVCAVCAVLVVCDVCFCTLYVSYALHDVKSAGMFVLFCADPQETAVKASEILRNERAVLTEVLDNNRCLLEFMNLMDSHKGVTPAPPPGATP